MSNTDKGAAANAAPTPLPGIATPEDAERLLRAATKPEQAWAIYEISADREGNWRAVKLKAERRYGELLGPAEPKAGPGRGNKSVTGSHAFPADRKKTERARKVAAVPQEKFDTYVTGNPNPSREGLLREYGKRKKAKSDEPKRDHDPSITGQKGLAHNPRVLDWVRKQTRAQTASKKIVALSIEGADGWPVPGEALSDGSLASCRAAIFHLEKAHVPWPLGSTSKKGPTWGGKQKRKLYEQIRESGETRLRRLRIDIAHAVMNLEHMVLPEDVGLSEESQDEIGTLYEELTNLQTWTEGAIKATIASMGDMKVRTTIQKLRALAKDLNASDGERRNATIAADRLEKKHRKLTP